MRATGRLRRHLRDRRGQALVEFALVVPIALLVIFGIIVLGLWIFFQQQITNVAREAARYAALHSSTAACPTASWRDPQAPPSSYPAYPLHCDGPNNPNDTIPWPRMTAHARSYAWAVNPALVQINACWSGYVLPSVNVADYASYAASAGFPLADRPAVEAGVANQFVQCTIGGINPITNADALGCATRMTTAADDPASDQPGNQVTVYACYQWAPPLAGFLLIPSSVTMKAVVTEIIQRQQ